MAKPLAAQHTGWHVAASALVLVALLAGPVAIVATMAKPQLNDEVVVAVDPAANGVPLDNPAVTDPGNIGSFAFGYVEFDVDPRRPGGVPGFDSWPPGSPRR